MHLFWKRIMTGALCAMTLLAVSVPALAAEDGYADAVSIVLEDDTVLVDGQSAPQDPDAAVYTARDIVYYEAGRDFTYGEGTEEDEHSAEEADGHTVVHITRPGTYVLRGALTRGQIAVDLGPDAKEDPDAVVTLVLDGADITCTVAPAVIFYSVYECDPADDSGAAPDLSGAGAVVVLADGAENNVSGSYVARIYKSYTLSDDGTAVTDSKKLHKYDGAFYSKMSMRVEGGGTLNITAENEGLDTERHLAMDGGTINIVSGNDGINVNEDDISVVTVNGGAVNITVTGATGEGDGIDSNGWLVINGGSVTAWACASSGDSGLDAAKGIYINGGTVAAAGNMLDPLQAEQRCAVFSFSLRQSGGVRYAVTGPDGSEVISCTPENAFTYLALSSPDLADGTEYALLADGVTLTTAPGGSGMGPGMGPGGMGRGPFGGAAPDEASELPDNMDSGEAPEPPDNMDPGEAPEPPDGTDPGEAPEPPDGMDPGEAPVSPEGMGPGGAPQRAESDAQAGADTFTLTQGVDQFRVL